MIFGKIESYLMCVLRAAEFSSAWIALVVLGGLVLGSVVVFLILRLLQAIGQGGSAVPVAGFFRQPGAIPRQIVTSQPVGRSLHSLIISRA